jgi:dCMP deaminase
VKNDTVIAIGYNGTPEGWSNDCETVDGSKTLPEVIHAEQNALDKVIRSNVSSVGSSVFVTTAPCIECAKRLYGARVKEVFYREVYRDEAGIDFLRRAGVHVEPIEV